LITRNFIENCNESLLCTIVILLIFRAFIIPHSRVLDMQTTLTNGSLSNIDVAGKFSDSTIDPFPNSGSHVTGLCDQSQLLNSVFFKSASGVDRLTSRFKFGQNGFENVREMLVVAVSPPLTRNYYDDLTTQRRSSQRGNTLRARAK